MVAESLWVQLFTIPAYHAGRLGTHREGSLLSFANPVREGTVYFHLVNKGKAAPPRHINGRPDLRPKTHA
jgi:hypothetical protein